MGKNYLSLELGGKERILKFNLRALKILKEQSGDDPFAFTLAGDLDEQFKKLSWILYAGLLSNAISQKQEPDFTIADCLYWAEEFDMSEATALAKAFGDAYKSDDASGEGSADTQQ
mgnify:CR=1 FL=1